MKKIGVYNPYLNTLGGGEKICLALAEVLSRRPDVEVSVITHEPVDLSKMASHFNVDLSRVGNYVTGSRMPLPPPAARSTERLSFRRMTDNIRIVSAIRRGHFDILVNNSYRSNMPNPAKQGVYMCMFPQKLREPRSWRTNTLRNTHDAIILGIYQLYRYAFHRTKRGIDTYQLITANSIVTQEYVQRRWGRDSQILYPFGEDMLDEKQMKKKIILNVGRFFAGFEDAHNRRRDFMIENFKELTSLHKQGWELHLAGSMIKGKGSAQYIAALKRRAKGFPIFFHLDCSFSELKKLYNDATIYWHATGYGCNPRTDPDKQEHFGISTVEAMSAKCVPVVIHSAGQKEAVAHGQTGYMWDTPYEFKKQTLLVAGLTPDSLRKMQETVRAGYSRCGKKAFEKSVNEMFGPLIEDNR